MNVAEIPVKNTITDDEIKNAYILGMKNVYPNDDIPVHELQRFPLTAYISDIDVESTKQLVQRLRNIQSDVAVKKTELTNIVSKVKQVTAKEVENAKLQSNENNITFDEVTSQLTEKFATHEEVQTAINNVYSALYNAAEEMMVQIFTTSMYARQYTPIIDDISATIPQSDPD